jgi:hypothetical protein
MEKTIASGFFAPFTTAQACSTTPTRTTSTHEAKSHHLPGYCANELDGPGWSQAALPVRRTKLPFTKPLGRDTRPLWKRALTQRGTVITGRLELRSKGAA